MVETKPQHAIDSDAEYRAIEQTLLGTARGRWFLAEHGRRSRRLDSIMLEDAMGRLSHSLSQPPPMLETLRGELEKLSAFIGETRATLVAKSSSGKPGANAGDGVAAGGDSTSGESPASDGMAPVARMLRMAEDIHELAWTLQAEELSPESCEAIARQSSMLYAMSRQQAMESERALQFAKALDDAANRMSVLLDALMHEINTYRGDTAPPPAEEAARKAG